MPHTAQTRFSPKPHWAGAHDPAMPFPRSKTWPCGTNATSRIPRIERFIGPGATITLDFALARLTPAWLKEAADLPDRMTEKTWIAWAVWSIPSGSCWRLTQAGVSRRGCLCPRAEKRD